MVNNSSILIDAASSLVLPPDETIAFLIAFINSLSTTSLLFVVSILKTLSAIIFAQEF
jgi:hypothetical protein